MNVFLCVVLGVFAGALSGLIGIGGGVILVPAFVYFLGMNQHQSQGTTLSVLLLPVGLLATYVYYRNGYVIIPVALFVSLGFLAGGFLGAKAATMMPVELLRKIFGTVLLAVSIQMIFFK